MSARTSAAELARDGRRLAGRVKRRSRRFAGDVATVARHGAERARHGWSSGRPLDIGLVGFFGWGNFGDELFLRTHLQQLSELGTVAPVHDLTRKPYFSSGIDEVVERRDAFVIGGGDLIIPWQVSELYWRDEYLRKPVYVVGVGVPTWRESSDRALRRYREFLSSPNVRMITARDVESQRWIEANLSPSVPVGCAPDLVWAMPTADVPPAAAGAGKVFGVVLRARGKTEDDFSQVRRLCDRAIEYGYSIRHIVLANLERGPAEREIAERFALPGEELVATESLDEQILALATCDMVASMKFHGTLVAAMHGVPAVSLSSTDKTRNFLTAIDRRDLFSAFNAPDLPDRVPRVPARISPHTRSAYRQGALEAYDQLRRAIVSDCNSLRRPR